MIINKKDHWEEIYQQKTNFVSKDGNTFPWDIKTHEPVLEDLIKDYNIKQGKVLELGCGLGHDLKFFYEKGFDVTGMDVSPTSIDLCKKNNKDSQIKYVVGDIDTDIPNERYNLIYDRGCLHGNPDLMFTFFPKVYNALDYGGKIIIISSNTNGADTKTASPPKLNIKDLINLSDPFFKVLLIKEDIFKLANGYEDVLGYTIVLEKRS